MTQSSDDYCKIHGVPFWRCNESHPTNEQEQKFAEFYWWHCWIEFWGAIGLDIVAKDTYPLWSEHLQK